MGLLDVDICGPSAPKMLGLKGHDVHKSAIGWDPVYVDRLAVMSIGFLLPEDDAPVGAYPTGCGVFMTHLASANRASTIGKRCFS